jgi:hypothetical protein
MKKYWSAEAEGVRNHGVFALVLYSFRAHLLADGDVSCILTLSEK